MSNWEVFEQNSCAYLNKYYANENVIFKKVGGSDATLSDIEVIKDGKTLFFIEAKMSGAQCGQFVLLDNNEEFVYSTGNKSLENEYSIIITKYINENYANFKSVSTSPIPIMIGQNILTNWVINHYLSKSVKFIITGYDRNNFIILPLDKLNNYFDITANFRVKRSGSRKLPLKYVNNAQAIINKEYKAGTIYYLDKKAFIKIYDKIPDKISLLGESYTYYLVHEEYDIYQIRILSNTANANVIFSCKLKQNQNREDLSKFENAIK